MHRRSFFEMSAGTLLATGLATVAAPTAKAAPRADASPAKETDAAAFFAQRKFVELPSGRIAYTDRGPKTAAGAKAALFLHGFPLNGFQWRGAIDRLDAHRRCIAPDSLGLGYTEPKNGQSVAPPAQVEMLASLLDYLKIDAVDLVANDSGGAIAQLFAIRFPKRVRTMLFTNCDVEIDSPPPALQPVLDAAHKGEFGSKFLKAGLDDKDAARGDKGIGGACYTYRVHPTDEALVTYLEPLTRDARRCALSDQYALSLEKNPLAGVEAKLKQLNIPARLVWGTADDIFPLRDGEYLASILPGSRGIRRVEGAKLFFPEEFPDVIADEAKRLWGVV